MSESLPEVDGHSIDDQKPILSTVTSDGDKVADDTVASTILKNTPPSSPYKSAAGSPQTSPSHQQETDVQAPKMVEVQTPTTDMNQELEIDTALTGSTQNQAVDVQASTKTETSTVPVSGEALSQEINLVSSTSTTKAEASSSTTNAADLKKSKSASSKNRSRGRYNNSYSTRGYRQQNHYHRTVVQNNYGLKSPPYKSNFEPSDSARQKAEEFVRSASINA